LYSFISTYKQYLLVVEPYTELAF